MKLDGFPLTILPEYVDLARIQKAFSTIIATSDVGREKWVIMEVKIKELDLSGRAAYDSLSDISFINLSQIPPALHAQFARLPAVAKTVPLNTASKRMEMKSFKIYPLTITHPDLGDIPHRFYGLDHAPDDSIMLILGQDFTHDANLEIAVIKKDDNPSIPGVPPL